VKGVAYDTPIPGYRVPTVNLLRLWSAEAVEGFDLTAFNAGDYERAVEEKIASETISKILYPNDEPAQGKRLRLEQQYFFAACSVQDTLRLVLQQHRSVEHLPEKFAIQLNDTHAAIAVAELMRLLVDVYGMEWEPAWAIVRRTVSYTNHTLLPEALETWPVDLIQEVLPRHLEIVYEINHRFLEEVRMHRSGDEELVARVSLIDESGGRRLRMAHLASVASHRINGVAELHSRLLRERVLGDFYGLEPGRFTSVTNGVTPRRFLLLGNPRLAALITEVIGERWIKDLERLTELEQHVGDASFRYAWREAKRHNKRLLAADIRETLDISVDPESLFDCHVKRIHEYKRQHLNILYVISEYLRLKDDPRAGGPRHTWLFAGKASPSYRLAKLMIELIAGVANVVNADPAVREAMRVVLLPNLNVRQAERLYAAADISEQISTAGTEASGTGNMKFALNGAVTIGTLDGANIEICERVGKENFLLFGLTEKEILERSRTGYRPRDYYLADPRLRAAIDAVANGRFSSGDPTRFVPLLEALLERDMYFVLADFAQYAACQGRATTAWNAADAWTRTSILNTARCGWFSSDRAVRDYCQRIWGLSPVNVVGQSD
jgi:starch phosphorylase